MIVNGGNCLFGDANWVHYVHAVYRPVVVGSPLKRLKAAVAHRRFLAEERRAIGSARTVIADSRRTARDVIDRLGVPAARVRTVYYGIDPALFRPPSPEERAQARAALGVPEDRKVLLFIGALGDRRKGFDTTFSAFERLARRDGWDGELWVVGHGGELDAWRARAKASGLDRWIRFLGFRRDVPTLLSAGDALVSPTRYEAYGLGIHEALCVGLPAIASASAGAAERYPASLAGLLLEDPEDDLELAAKLETWRADVDGWRAKVAPVGAALREQTWDRMGAESSRSRRADCPRRLLGASVPGHRGLVSRSRSAPARDQPAVEREQLGPEPPVREPPRRGLVCGGAELSARCRGGDEPAELGRERTRVPGREAERVDPVVEELARAARRAHHHRPATGHRLDHGEPERLGLGARVDDDVERAVDARGVAGEGHEPDPAFEAEPGHLGLELGAA